MYGGVRTPYRGAVTKDENIYLINQTPGEKLRHGVAKRASATLVDLTLVLWTPGPIRSHREEFLPEGLRAYGRPLYAK